MSSPNKVPGATIQTRSIDPCDVDEAVLWCRLLSSCLILGGIMTPQRPVVGSSSRDAISDVVQETRGIYSRTGRSMMDLETFFRSFPIG